MKKIIVEYSANNSGGSWWLSDKDWLELEKNGWHLILGDYIYNKKGGHEIDKNGFPKFNKEGFVRFNSGDKRRYMGSLCHYAFLKCESIEDAIKSFEEHTGQDAGDEGCYCCGQPHNFYEFR